MIGRELLRNAIIPGVFSLIGCVAVYHPAMPGIFPFTGASEVDLRVAAGGTGNEVGVAFFPTGFLYVYGGGILGNKKLKVADTLLAGVDPKKESMPLYGEGGIGSMIKRGDLHIGMAISGGKGIHTLYTTTWTNGVPALTKAYFTRFSVSPFIMYHMENSEIAIAARLSYLDFYSIKLLKKDTLIPQVPGDIYIEPALFLMPGFTSFRFLLCPQMTIPLVKKNNYTYLGFTMQVGFVYIIGGKYKEFHEFYE